MSHPRTIRFREPRRKDRAVRDEQWICDLLLRAPMGVMATHGEPAPGLNPNLFAFDPDADAIYLHTARRGDTRDQVESRCGVSFCVWEMGRILPAPRARDFSLEYASVILQGSAFVVDTAAEALHGLDLLMRKYAPDLAPGEDYAAANAAEVAQTSVFRIDIESWSGKGKWLPTAPGYEYTPPYPMDLSCPASHSSTARASGSS